MIVARFLRRLLPEESEFCDECVDQFAPEVCVVCGVIVADGELHERWHVDLEKERRG